MYEKYIKRVLDVLTALLVCPIAVIVIIIAAIFIILDDGFPVFYAAKRIGRNGTLFKMYKLRSMKTGAPDIRLADGSTYNGEQDPRVTKTGRVLRKLSLDEVPQIWNVLKGEMSWIGFRPDPPDWMNKYPVDMRGFLKTRPGITGYNQVYYRNSASSYEKIKNDLYYARHCSFLMDVNIFFRTIVVVLGRKHIYRELNEETNKMDEWNRKKLNDLAKK